MIVYNVPILCLLCFNHVYEVAVHHDCCNFTSETKTACQYLKTQTGWDSGRDGGKIAGDESYSGFEI